MTSPELERLAQSARSSKSLEPRRRSTGWFAPPGAGSRTRDVRILLWRASHRLEHQPRPLPRPALLDDPIRRVRRGPPFKLPGGRLPIDLPRAAVARRQPRRLEPRMVLQEPRMVLQELNETLPPPSRWRPECRPRSCPCPLRSAATWARRPATEWDSLPGAGGRISQSRDRSLPDLLAWTSQPDPANWGLRCRIQGRVPKSEAPESGTPYRLTRT
jgi:hypothetical protein